MPERKRTREKVRSEVRRRVPRPREGNREMALESQRNAGEVPEPENTAPPRGNARIV
ncbi:hypothetical protein [Nocardiopsis sp. CNR-923]|uniref:hypothetical protein n=1 Tax=Nocardiopsis sp. CNR-923 TaxID=1904965 RepID=UPI001300CF1C|nr:hypothetical protein [Nocardiopsis sp. CNR-923]